MTCGHGGVDTAVRPQGVRVTFNWTFAVSSFEMLLFSVFCLRLSLRCADAADSFR